jgi:hypothetical protein
MGALADRIGHAYGLGGDHRAWARTPQADLGEQIRAGLPAALARHEAERPAPAAALKGMDDAFKAGSQGGPAQGAFQEDLIMGVPSGPPRWIYAVIAVTALLVGAAIVLVAAR